MVIWNILWSFGTFYGHLVHFMVIWYIFYRFGMLYREKSGRPDSFFCLPGKFIRQRGLLLRAVFRSLPFQQRPGTNPTKLYKLAAAVSFVPKHRHKSSLEPILQLLNLQLCCGGLPRSFFQNSLGYLWRC
jgi:hypothetical protein